MTIYIYISIYIYLLCPCNLDLPFPFSALFLLICDKLISAAPVVNGTKHYPRDLVQRASIHIINIINQQCNIEIVARVQFCYLESVCSTTQLVSLFVRIGFSKLAGSFLNLDCCLCFSMYFNMLVYFGRCLNLIFTSFNCSCVDHKLFL